MSIDAFVKRFSGGSSLGPPLHFYHDTNGVPQIILRFDAEKHKYFLVKEDGSLEAQQGVTRACQIVDKSLYLMPWAAKMCVEQLLRVIPKRTRDDGVEVAVELPMVDLATIANECKSAHKNRVEDASDIGHIAHDCLEKSILHAIANTSGVVLSLVNYPTDEKAASCCDAAFKWMKEHKVVWLAAEKKVYSRKYKVAGTMDGLCLVSSCENYLCCENSQSKPAFVNRLSIADWKSSNSLHIEYLAQTAIYEHSEEEENGHNIEDRWILRLGKEDGEFEPWHLTADCYALDLEFFLCCLALVRVKEAVEERMAAARKLRTAAKRAAKADAKRLEKDAERVAKALAKATKKAEREAALLQAKTDKATARQLAKQTRDTERAARKLRKAKKDDVPTYASAPEIKVITVTPAELASEVADPASYMCDAQEPAPMYCVACGCEQTSIMREFDKDCPCGCACTEYTNVKPTWPKEPATVAATKSNVINLSSATANMYGCEPCPKCQSVTRCVFQANPQQIDCDACGLTEQIATEPAPEDCTIFLPFPWFKSTQDTTVFGRVMSDGDTCTVQPLGDRWEIAAVIAGQKYRGTRDVLADAFSAADALVKSKLGTQVTQ